MNKVSKYYFLAFAFLVPSFLCAASNADFEKYFQMPLEELLDLELKNASLISIPSIKSPVSVTSISSSEIAMSPARNIYDLIEFYVPGAIWMHHHDVPHLGMRGLIGDRNNKVIVLVNGRNMNLKAHSGATSELENWDLSDIDKIEIVRGTGSVTYGPAAAAGVIKITTKNALTSEGLNANVSYSPNYQSKGLSLSYGLIEKDFDLFMFASIFSSKGSDDSRGFRGYNDWETQYIDENQNYTANNYFEDYFSQPQYKFYLEANFLGDWKFWSRWTNSGMQSMGIPPLSKVQEDFDNNGKPILGKPQTLVQNRNRHLTFTLENNKQLSEDFALQSIISYDYEDYIRQEEGFLYFDKSSKPPEDVYEELLDRKHLRNQLYNFGEQELQLKSILNYKASEILDFAIGAEYSFNVYGSPLFGDRTDFKLGDNHNIISGYDSKAFNDFNTGIEHWARYGGVDSSNAIFIGDGWKTHTISLMAESYFDLTKELEILISARYDKDSYSPHLFSPRLALIYSIDKSNTIKWTMQRYQRMNIAQQQIVQRKLNSKPESESLLGTELIYTSLQNDNFYYSLTAFYNNIDFITWKEEEEATRFVGEAKLAGLEFEAKYKSDDWELIFSHSFIKQISWNQDPSVKWIGLTYSDTDFELIYDGAIIDTLHILGVGNDLLNWSNHNTKMNFKWDIVSNQISLLADCQVYWNFQGGKDGLVMLENAKKSIKDTARLERIEKILDRFDEENIYNAKLNVNLALQYTPFDNWELKLKAYNLLPNLNTRYIYDSGLRFNNSIFRAGWVKEEMMLMLSLGYRF